MSREGVRTKNPLVKSMGSFVTAGYAALAMRAPQDDRQNRDDDRHSVILSEAKNLIPQRDGIFVTGMQTGS